MTPAPAFPLAGVVAVVGSRHGSPYSPAQLAAAVVGAGASLVTGCASGVDHTAASAAAAAAGVAPLRLLPPQYLALSTMPRVLVCRAGGRTAADLATRTRHVVSFASAVIICPPAGGQLGPGSALALRTAQARALPVFCAGPVPPAPGFQPAAVAGVPGWSWLPPSPMPSLF